MRISTFIGREKELKKLQSFSQKRIASFIVVKGRRRIGKSRLIQEFAKGFDAFYIFAGIPPHEGVTKESQLEEFSRQIALQFNSPYATFHDWGDALWAVGKQIQSSKILLFFDEISWMGSEDPTFLGKIKNFWDLQAKNNSALVFVVCGSASSWIEKNLLSSTGFVGRISYTLTLKELPLNDCNKFWPTTISAYEKLKVLSVTGGIPRYLEEIDPKLTAEDNIKDLCFTHGGFLVDEFEKIFSDLFLHQSSFYKKMLAHLVTGPHDQAALCQALGIDPSGRMSEYLEELSLAGFITRDHTWNLSTGADAKLSKYRLSDNYLRFYLKYIETSLSKINRETFEPKSLTTLPEWNTIMGLQFENLIINNRHLIKDVLGIKAEDVVCDNPFFQNKTVRMPGCQIDYMIQTKTNTLYVCEIKFSKTAIGSEVVHEVKKKIAAIKAPRAYSFRPVLIHVNGVSEDIIDQDYFTHIIDATRFLV